MVHIVSDQALQRKGWKYTRMGDGGYVGWHEGIQPSISWKHIDGPLLYTSDCGLHWLTFWERIQMYFGWTDLHALDRKHQRKR